MRTCFYIPGMLGATGLLLLLNLLLVPRFTPVKNETVTRFTLPSEDRNNMFSGYRIIGKMLQEKKIIHTDLTGNNEEDDEKIRSIQFINQHLLQTSDTSSIIEIHLSNEITYSRFVALTNMMLEDGNKRYALWKDNFYIIF